MQRLRPSFWSMLHTRLLDEAGQAIEAMVATLDPSSALPIALRGGLAAALRPYVQGPMRARFVAPQGDSAQGALWLARQEKLENVEIALAI